jgi:hypothetical protein
LRQAAAKGRVPTALPYERGVQSLCAALAQPVAALVELDRFVQCRLAAFQPADDAFQFLEGVLERQALDRHIHAGAMRHGRDACKAACVFDNRRQGEAVHPQNMASARQTAFSTTLRCPGIEDRKANQAEVDRCLNAMRAGIADVVSQQSNVGRGMAHRDDRQCSKASKGQFPTIRHRAFLPIRCFLADPGGTA